MISEQQRILRFWWMLELFSPQTVPKITGRSSRPADRQVVQWCAADRLPWQTLGPPPPLGRTPRVWKHTVYLGVYELGATYERLQRVFGADADAYEERPGGRSAGAGLLIDQDGRLVPGSPVLSSALWAVACIESQGPDSRTWADGFPLALERLREAVDAHDGDRREAAGTDLPPAHDATSMLELLRIVQDVCGVRGVQDLATDHVIIDSVAVPERRSEDRADIDFLNSFYLEELTAVRADLDQGGRTAPALAAYLTGGSSLDVSGRVDVCNSPQAVDAGVTIDRLPKGRWPVSPEKGLALSQQFAVNRALNDLAPTSGLMGVNGPPGTGKTTMLRDILAGNVVERARRLATLRRPEDAFTSTTHRWTAQDGHPRRVRQLRSDLSGFEMVVASANNAAVENVSAEIPAQGAIDAPWRGHADYFADIASAVSADVVKDSGEEGTRAAGAWGLVAAKLGNKRNRSTFHSAFWFDKKDPHTKEPAVGSPPRMQTRLAQWRDGTVPYQCWEQARECFVTAERRVDALIGARRQAEQRRAALQQAIRDEQNCTARKERCVAALHTAECAVAEHAAVTQGAAGRLARATAHHDRHLAARPAFLEALFSLGRALRDWRVALTSVAEELAAAERHEQQVLTQDHLLHEGVEQSCADLVGAESKLSRVRRGMAKLDVECAADRDRYGTGYPGEEWTGERRELNAPWLDAELDTARSELFLAALQLHQDFLANAAGEMAHGLRAAGEVVAGNYPHRLEPEKLRAAWQLFFMVVPLVSTTFASFGRMFGDVGSEAIGWLLIDEAGQACPQYAAGAIWRSRRVVAVGDPLQLQPVVTLPQKARYDIAGAFGISATWIAPQASVQTLADRVSSHGTMLQRGEDRVWVSAPLRVHRRCDEPMFTLCNQIAYEGIMVNGVRRRPASPPDPPDPFDTLGGPVIAPSHWVDEPAPHRGSHLQENQIVRLERALAYLGGRGVAMSEVIAISPFRAVAGRLESLAPRYPGLRAGTIHTAQGREAAVVILVLGGDPGSTGAKAWAASSVNLVNVAASRAKRRLYVIGDRTAWAKHNYFHQLANALNTSGVEHRSDRTRSLV